MEGGTFGAAVDANDNAWLTSYGSKYSKRTASHCRRQKA
jgi:hypothetical protein